MISITIYTFIILLYRNILFLGERYIWKRSDEISETSASRVFISGCTCIYTTYSSVHFLYG